VKYISQEVQSRTGQVRGKVIEFSEHESVYTYTRFYYRLIDPFVQKTIKSI